MCFIFHPVICSGVLAQPFLSAFLLIPVLITSAFFFFTERFVGIGYAIAQFVEVLSYKPEGRGLDSRWGL